MTNPNVELIIVEIRGLFPDEDDQPSFASPIEFIRRLIDSRNATFTAEDVDILEILIRKVDVAKRVFVTYDTEWRRPKDKTPVSSGVLLGLALCLAWFGTAPPNGEFHGQSLKWMNAAFNAVDLANKSANADLALIESTTSFLRCHLDDLLFR